MGRWLIRAMLSLPLMAGAQEQPFHLGGEVIGAGGQPVAGAVVTTGGGSATTDAGGHFELELPRGAAHVTAQAGGYVSFAADLLVADVVAGDRQLRIALLPGESVTVRPGADVLSPDPSGAAYAREDLLPANPGRPGIPFSVPGFPTETASGGIKAPQYFAPGVAGDHGEPIAQFFQVGNFLFQNNLTANAHGNGYADPNLVIPAVVSGVAVDNAAFNARYGDHSINLAVNYGIRDRLASFAQVTSDGRDGDVSGGWPWTRGTRPGWAAGELSFGNGFLARPEEREQYKLNGLKAWAFGRHELTVFGAGYYGFSRIPGLIPLRAAVADDTLDPRQKDLTHTTLLIATDSWLPSARQALTVAGYARTYSLALDSNFGDGLIEQSEWRTVAGGNGTWTRGLGSRVHGLLGMDWRRDAPRGLDLARTEETTGRFRLVTSNDLTISDYGPFAALQGSAGAWLRWYVGLRRDEIGFVNRDLVNPANSYRKTPGVTSPKATVTWGREEEAGVWPQVSLSFGKAFHANDPRIGSGNARGALIVQSREYQLIAAKVVEGTELRLTLAHQTNSEELAKIDPDTGLQEDVGPSVNRYFTLMARRRYGRGFLQASYSQANATDRLLRAPLPEAPRLIIDAIGTAERLPWGVTGKAEYEYVGEKPLGDGFHAVPVQEVRLDLERPLRDGRWVVLVNGELVNGASGQTLETPALPGEGAAFERVVGVPLRSYGAVSLRYAFGH